MIKIIFGIVSAIYPFLVFYLIVIKKADSGLLSLFVIVFAMFAFFAMPELIKKKVRLLAKQAAG